jgi:predicted Zn-dependent protease
MTMNAGTSLRVEGTINGVAASSIGQPWVTAEHPAPLLPYSAASVRPFRRERMRGINLRGLVQWARFACWCGRQAEWYPQAAKRMANQDSRYLHPMTTADEKARLQRKPGPRMLALATAAAVIASSFPNWPAYAQPRRSAGPPIIRDAEVEQLLREYTQPILRAAGLAKQNIRIVIINDRSFNAFVADGRRIFINAGALMEATTPNQVIGVLAHETGHIAGGHLARMREQIQAATTQSIIALVLGAGALVAASRSGSSGASQAGMAALSAPQAVIQNSLIAYVRTQEESADRAGVKFLAATGQSTKGMYETFKRLADQVLYQTRYIDPYMQTHPMPSERVRALERLAKASPYWNKADPPALQMRHDLMRAKLYGFLDPRDGVARHYRVGDNSVPARYARAIAAYRFSDLRGAVVQIDGLIQQFPKNPYFHELKGQALLEAGRPAEAIAPLRRAVQLAPNPSLIQIMLGQALLATNNKAYAEEAVRLLEAALRREPESSEAYLQIAMAYGRKGDLARADLASAQAAFMRGDLKTARQLAARAKTRFPVGSPGWVKADDLASYKPRPPAQN